MPQQLQTIVDDDATTEVSFTVAPIFSGYLWCALRKTDPAGRFETLGYFKRSSEAQTFIDEHGADAPVMTLEDRAAAFDELKDTYRRRVVRFNDGTTLEDSESVFYMATTLLAWWNVAIQVAKSRYNAGMYRNMVDPIDDVLPPVVRSEIPDGTVISPSVAKALENEAKEARLREEAKKYLEEERRLLGIVFNPERSLAMRGKAAVRFLDIRAEQSEWENYEFIDCLRLEDENEGTIFQPGEV